MGNGFGKIKEKKISNKKGFSNRKSIYKIQHFYFPKFSIIVITNFAFNPNFIYVKDNSSIVFPLHNN